MKKFAAAMVVAASASILQAQPYYVVGDVIDGWASPSTVLMNGGPTVYNYAVTGGTAGNYEQLKVTAGSWGTAWPGNNLVIRLDATGGNTIYFYPGTVTDGWQPIQNRVGFADPGNMSFEIAGDFTNPNWASDPNAQMTLKGSGVYTNTYVIATPGTHNFKFRTPGTWSDFNGGSDFGGGNNATVTTTTTNQSVLFQLDVVNGRWLAGALAPPPVTNAVVFAVDMTYQTQLGFFTPGSSVFVAGAFNGWPGPGSTNSLQLTNYPPYLGGSNTNIYYGTNVFVGVPDTAVTQYKFNQNDPNAQNSGWETSNNRSVTLLSTNGTVVLPVAIFSDLYGSDVLNVPVTIIFTVNMTNAVTYTNGTTLTDAHVFNSSSDSVVINGSFLNGGWSAWDPISTSGQIMTNNPIGSEVYEFDYTLPAGSPLEFQYKYGVNYPGMTNNLDNEAGFNVNHDRVVRLTGTGVYNFPLDNFGGAFTEPSFGLLTAGKAVGGNVPVTWLGRPGARLQSKSDLSGAWQDIPTTDGTNWITGYMSTNGFVSQTNWPASTGHMFFRIQLH